MERVHDGQTSDAQLNILTNYRMKFKRRFFLIMHKYRISLSRVLKNVFLFNLSTTATLYLKKPNFLFDEKHFRPPILPRLLSFNLDL